jgi:prepilin-type N-terminal cleavage/methylation domain-containing protein
MKNKTNKQSGFTLIELLVVVAIILILFCGVFHSPIMGFFPFGPEKQIEAKVERLYVDRGNEKSYYMVGTDNGVFEVDDSVWLGIYNSDELYARLKEGESYILTTKGVKMTNFFFREYPHIIEINKL